jgi:CheY-like chemotaxis protein
MLAHELRNPLAPIRNAVEILRRGDDDPCRTKARDLIDRQVSHLVRLVDDLLDVSRITRGKIQLQMSVVALRDIITEAVEVSRPLLERGRHRFELDLPDEPILLNADPTRLAQVFANLLNNAAKYTDPGGEIRLSISRRGQDAIVSVRDTGVGIPRDMLHRVFDLFTQVDRSLDRSYGGLGIGLTLVRRLVDLHGGTVTVASEGPGRGSEFQVTLAVAQEQAIPPKPAAPPKAPPSKPLQVLVVDDNVDAAESLATLLRLAGHTVKVAHNGAVALEAAAALPPDVTVLDIGLPGMDGYSVARQLRQRPETRDAVLIAVTGYGRDEDRVLSRQAGFDHHFVKPLQFDVLQRMLAMTHRKNGSNAAELIPS